MTDFEKKIIQLKKKNADFDTYMGVNDNLVIQEFINDYEFIETIFSEDEKFIEEYAISAYPTL